MRTSCYRRAACVRVPIAACVCAASDLSVCSTIVPRRAIEPLGVHSDQPVLERNRRWSHPVASHRPSPPLHCAWRRSRDLPDLSNENSARRTYHTPTSTRNAPSRIRAHPWHAPRPGLRNHRAQLLPLAGPISRLRAASRARGACLSLTAAASFYPHSSSLFLYRQSRVMRFITSAALRFTWLSFSSGSVETTAIITCHAIAKSRAW